MLAWGMVPISNFGEGCVSRTFSHAAVNNPGVFTWVGGRDRSFLFVSCNAFHCEGVNNGSGAGLLPVASLRSVIVRCFLDSCRDATKFSQFGRHFNHGFVGYIQSLREFLNFLVFS